MLFSFFQEVGGVDYPHFRFNFKKKIGREIGNFFGTDRQTDTDYSFLSGCYLESCTLVQVLGYFRKKAKLHLSPHSPSFLLFFAAYL